MTSKISVEKALGSIAEFCELVEQPEGILIKPKKPLEHTQFLQLYQKAISIGGQYLLGKMQFLIPVSKPPPGSVAARERHFQIIPLTALEPSPLNIRVEAVDAEISELVENVKLYGLLQPIVVRPLPDERYEVVAGLRRFKAAEKAGLDTLPCIIVSNLTDQEAMETTLVENTQRKDLTDYELGKWLKEIMRKFPEAYPNQEALASRIGKDRSYVSLLISHYEHIENQKEALPPEIVTRVTKLPERVTREVREAPPEIQPEIIKTVVKEDLSARETKRVVQALTVPQVSTEEALKALQEDTKRRLEAAKAKEEMLRLKKYYPASMVDEAKERFGPASEEKMRIILTKVVEAMWLKLAELGLTDQILSEATTPKKAEA